MIRVLDIYKTNGRVENDNNVQIYRNVDPIAQEWLIIPVSRFHYKIVPRSNPALALTSYGSSNGSASGKSATSAGNVFVSTYTGNNPNQLWQIYKTDRTQVKNDYIGNISSNTYYVINRESGNLIKNTNNSLLLGKGTSDLAMISRAWKITKIDTNTYTVQPENRSDLFLCGNTTAKTVSLQGSPNHYWSSEPAAGIGGLRLTMRSGSTKYALTESNGSLVLQTVSTQSGTSAYYRQAWYFYAVDTYTEITKATFSNLNISYGNTASAKVTSVQPTGAAMTAASNFTYTGGGNVVSIDNLTGTFKGLNNGTVTITATHKVHTNVKATFTITVTGKPDPEPEPEPEVENPTSYEHWGLTLQEARLFYFPFSDIHFDYCKSSLQNSVQTWVNYKSPNAAYEMFDTFCQEIQNPWPAGLYNGPMGSIGYLGNGTNDTDSPFLELVRRSKVAVIFTHGADSTLISLNDGSNGESLHQLTVDDILDLPDNYFSYCELVIFLACNTADPTTPSFENFISLIEAFKEKGAQNVVGFNDTIKVEQSVAYLHAYVQCLLPPDGQNNKIELFNPQNPDEPKLTDAERKIRSFEEAANLAAELVDENLTFEGFAYPLVAIYEYR